MKICLMQQPGGRVLRAAVHADGGRQQKKEGISPPVPAVSAADLLYQPINFFMSSMLSGAADLVITPFLISTIAGSAVIPSFSAALPFL